MERRWGWFEIGVQAFALVGLIAVLGLGALGIRRLFLRRAAAPPVAGSTAAIAVEPKHSTAEPVRSLPPPWNAAKSPSSPRSTIADLAVTIIGTGVLDAAGGAFRSQETISRGEQPAILFEVINLGGVSSERWRFTAGLPTFAGQFSSPEQPPLAPGERVRFTLGFLELNGPGANRAVITVDPENRLRDADRENDFAAAVLVRSY